MGATTWSTPLDSLTTDQLLDYITVFQNSALQVYGKYLKKVKGFEKNKVPIIGNKWQSER